MLYFAYGSNMDPSQIRTRCRDAEFFATGFLPDHELWFPRRSKARNCGVSSIRPTLGRSTWGVIFRLSDADIAELDRSEGFRKNRDSHLNAYNRVNVLVMVDDAALAVCTYVAEEQQNPPMPSIDYLNLLRSGARHFRLPQAYQEYLSKIVAG